MGQKKEKQDLERLESLTLIIPGFLKSVKLGGGGGGGNPPTPCNSAI